MANLDDDLKAQTRMLHRLASSGEPNALERLRLAKEFRLFPKQRLRKVLQHIFVSI